MNKILKVIFWIILLFQSFSVAFAATWKFQYSLDRWVSSGLQHHLNPRQTTNEEWSWRTVVDFVFNIVDDIAIPVAVAVWVVIWLIWAYKLLFSSDEKQVSTWLKMVIFWIIWIIIMVSAKYIWTVLFRDIFSQWEINPDNISWIDLSQKIYNQIAYPFIKIAIYLALTVIFIILVWKSISLITKSDWTSQKKALWMIGRCAVSMLLVIWAKSIVEAIYWKQDDVFRSVSNLWEIWSWILRDKNIPLVYNIISRALWIVSLVILILLIVQWFKILINPSKAENFQKLWKHLLFTTIWLFVIWIVYLLTNAFILN